MGRRRQKKQDPRRGKVVNFIKILRGSHIPSILEILLKFIPRKSGRKNRNPGFAVWWQVSLHRDYMIPDKPNRGRRPIIITSRSRDVSVHVRAFPDQKFLQSEWPLRCPTWALWLMTHLMQWGWDSMMSFRSLRMKIRISIGRSARRGFSPPTHANVQ